MPSSDGKLRVAIIGGGLAGATLMNALLKYSHLSPEIFESAPEFSERGAAVGIAQNGQAALAEIAPELAGALDRAGAVVMSSSRVRMVSWDGEFRVMRRGGTQLGQWESLMKCTKLMRT